MKVTSFLFLWLGVLGGFADLAEAVTPADVLETSLCEPDGAKKIPWFKCHPIILGMGIYETNVLKNYAKYIPFEFEKDEKPATIKLIGELFGWQNGEFKVATSLGQIGTYLTLEQAGTISGMLTASKSLDKLHKALMNFCCSAGCQKDFGFNKGKMKRRFVDVLVQAESEWKDQALFPSHMPLLIFYAFVYQKAKSRAELVDFFKAFLKADPKLKGCEPFGPDNESFLSEPSVLEIEQPGARSWITVQADAAKLAEEKFFGGEGLDYDEEVAAVAVAQNWKNFDIPPRMPAKISISQTKGEYNDCVEDVLYKFLLLLRKHCAPIVQNVLDDKKNASLLECLDNKDLMLKKVGHEQWNHVVIGGHVPYMIYRQVVCDGKCLTRKEQCAVCLPPSSPLVPKDAPKSGLFKAVNSPMLAFLQDGNCTGYEVSSHLSNIIIGVDHVLKLNLNFAVEDLANFWNETFCEIYFKELGAKLGVSFIFKVQEKDSFMQVAFRLADQDLLIFSKEFLHIGILSMRNIMPFKLLKNDKEVSEIDYFTNFLETNGLPERRAHCRYPLSLFTGSWEDFDSKNKVRERFLSAHLKGLSFLAAISDQLACEMEPK